MIVLVLGYALAWAPKNLRTLTHKFLRNIYYLVPRVLKFLTHSTLCSQSLFQYFKRHFIINIRRETAGGKKPYPVALRQPNFDGRQ